MDTYPTLLDLSKDECRRILRNLELEAYSNLVSVLRAQGSLSSQKKRLLQNVAQTLSIPVERHKAECRRAVASEKLATIAKYMEGPNTATDWAIEGRRLVPLMPRLVPQTAFTALADQVANMAATERAKFPPEQLAKASANAGTEECFVEEPDTPEASKTVEMCINPAATVTMIPSPSATTSQILSQEKNPNFWLPSAQPQPVHLSHSEELTEDKVSRKRGRASSLDSHSGDVPGAVTVQPPSKKFQENVDITTSVSISRPPVLSAQLSPVLSVPTVVPVASQPQSSQKTAVKLRTKSPIHQIKVPRPPESETLEKKAQVEIRSETQTQPPPPLATSHIVQPPQAAPVANTVSRVVPNHVKMSLAGSPAQVRTTQSPAVNASSTSSAGTQKVIIVSSTTPSILQRSLTVPVVKAATAAANNQKQSSVVLNTVVSNQPNSNQQHSTVPIQPSESPAVSKPSSTLQTVITPHTTATGTTVTATATAKSSLNNSTQGPTSSVVASNNAHPAVPTGVIVSAKVAPKSRPRGNSIVIPMTLNQPASGGASVSNVQLKTFGTKPTTLHLKQDSAVKIMPITSVGGTKILPKPSSGQMFLVSSASGSTPTVSMVTRTVPTGARVMAVSSLNSPRAAGTTSNLSGPAGRPATILSVSSKQGQAVQMGLNSGNVGFGGTTSKPNVIVVQKGSSGALGRGVTLTHGGKEVVGKVLLGKAVSTQGQNTPQGGRHSVTVQKFTNAAAMLQATGNQNQGNVIVLDLSQEHLSNNAVLNELLQASGVLPFVNRNIPEPTSSNVSTTNTSSVANTTAKVLRTKGDAPLPCVSSDWLQTSDISSCVVSDNSVGSLDGIPARNVESATPKGTTTISASPSVVVQSVVPTTSTGMDIFSTALSSADINLDNFQYLEDSSLDGLPSQLGVHSTENSSASNNSSCFVGEHSEQSLDGAMDCN